MPKPDWITRPSLKKGELAEHLSVSCLKTLDNILRGTGLNPKAGSFPWARIFRAVHRTETFLLPTHLTELKARHGTPNLDDIEDEDTRAATQATQGSPIINSIEDLEAELRDPLLSFDEMARELGWVPNTLSKALREGRETLPFPTLQLGPRLRHYRPLEVRLWRDEGILLGLPPARPIAPAALTVAAANPRPEEVGTDAATLAEQTRKAVFGVCAGNRGKKSG